MLLTKYGIMSGGPPAPVILSAGTSTDGKTITITFDKLMIDPSAYKSEFAVSV
jgi:hypothetical protein